PGVAIEPEAVADELIGTDEVGAETDLSRYSLARGLLVAREPEALHLAHVVAVALAFECVVVEVGCRRPHRAEGERVTLGMTPPRGFDVVGEFEPNADRKVEIVERASRVGSALTNRVEEEVGRLGEERVADPPVGQLAREPKIVRAECGDVDRYVRRWHERADASAFAM